MNSKRPSAVSAWPGSIVILLCLFFIAGTANAGMSINGGASYTSSTAVSIVMTPPSGLSGYSIGYSTDGYNVTPGNNYPATTTLTYNLPTGDGYKGIQVAICYWYDSGGWGGGYWASYTSDYGSIYLDTTGPTGGSISVSGGGLYANTNPVNLSLSAYDAGSSVTTMQLSNDGTNWTLSSYATLKAWTLATPTGNTVYAKFKDLNGYWSATTSANITIESSPPTSAVTNPADGSSISGVSYTITGTASDAGPSGVKSVSVNAPGSSGTASGTTAWSYNWTLPINGTYSISSLARDNAGNAQPAATSVSVIVANPLPVTTIALADNSSFTGGHYTLTGTASAAPGLSVAKVELSLDGGATWKLLAGTTSWQYYWPLLSSGNLTIHSRATDSIGNVGNPAVVHLAVTADVDTTAPTTSIKNRARLSKGSFQVTGTCTDGAGTGVQKVELSFDNGATWQPANDTSVNGDWSGWAKKTFSNLTSVTVLARATDWAGNQENQSSATTVALYSTAGQVSAWGSNSNGQIGTGSTDGTLHTPTNVNGLNDVTAVASGLYHTLALRKDGTVWSWGYNSNGQLGNGSSPGVPAVVPGLSGIIAIAAGEIHSLALKNDGTVWGWGYNGYGQLGTPNVGGTSGSPTQIPGLSGIVAISSGLLQTVALKNDGTVWTLGYNGYDGGAQHATPVQVLTGCTAIAGGVDFTLALKNDGSVWSWGGNYYYELGRVGGNYNTPGQVSGLDSVVDIAAGVYHGLALRSDGTVWSWGYNSNGQLGDGTTNTRYQPTMINGISNVASVSSKYYFSAAVKKDGSVWTWGDNGYGQLSRSGNSLVPGQAAGISNVYDVSTAYYVMTALSDTPTPTSFAVSAPATATAGEALTFTVTALDQFGNPATGYTGTAHFTSSDAQATLPANYTFSGADAGIHTFVSGVTLKTSGTQAVSATDTVTATITGTQAAINVNPAAADTLVVSGITTPRIVWTAGTVTVETRDAYNNRATGYLGTVRFTSSDAQATLPANYTFSGADAGIHTFVSGVTVKTSGTQTVSANDTVTATITGTQTAINVNPDTTYPTAAISYSPAGPYKMGDTVTITADFSEPLADNPVTKIDISAITGGNALPAANMIKASATRYTYSHTVGSGNGTANVSLSTGTDLAGNAVTAIPTSGGIFTVVKTSATVDLSGLAPTYDGNPKNATVTTTPPGLTVDLTYNGSATVPTTASSYDIVATINDASYQGSANGTLTIAKAPQSITNFDATASKTYGDADFGPGATIDSGLPITYESDNTVVATVTPEGLVHIAGSGPVKITAKQNGDTNHLPASAEQSLTINKVQIQVTADNKSRSYGAADPAFTPGYSGFVSGENSSVITGTPTFTTTAIAASPEGSYVITPDVSGLSATNYSFTPAPGTLAIGLASQSITFNPLAARTYGDTAFALTASGGASNNPVTYTSSDTNVATVSGAIVTIKGFGPTTITANQAGTAGQYASATAQQILTVNKARITVTAANKQRPYNTPNPTFTATYGGFVYSDDITVITGTPTFTASATQASPTGSYTIVPVIDGLSAANYTFAAANGTLAVDVASQSITFDPLVARTYGDDAFDLSASGGASGNTVTFTSSNPAVAMVNGPTVTIKGVGTTTITASQAGNGNYASATAQQLLIVNKAALTVTAKDASRAYNTSDPVFSVAYSGFAYGETESILAGTLSLSTTATITSPVGDYPITVAVGNLASNNYAFSFVNGALTIIKATAGVSLDSATLNRTFDGSQKAVTAATTPPELAYLVTYNGSAIVPGNAGSYAVVATVNDASYQGSSSGTLVIRDIAGPALTISTLADGSITSNATLNISGSAADDSGIAGVTINGAPVTITSGSFSHALTLLAGANTITTIATDTQGNSTTDTRTITLDSAAPMLTISAPADNSKTAQLLAAINGTVNETSAVTVTVNGGTPRNASIAGNSFNATVSLASGLNTITVSATDLAGNTSSAVRTVTYDNTNPSLAITSPNQDITTAQNSITVSGTVSDAITNATVKVTFDSQSYFPAVTNGAFSQPLTIPAEGSYAITATATDEAGNSSSATRNLIYSIIAVSGACGSANGTTVTMIPTANLCTDGTASTVGGTGPWTWTCAGVKGGTTAACSAILPKSGIVFPAPGKTRPDLTDALRTLNILTGGITPTAADYDQLDVAPLDSNGRPHGDNKIDTYDAIGILRMLVGLL